MKKEEVIEAVRKFGKTAYVARRGDPILKKDDSDTPHSIIGSITHHTEHEEWPLFKGQHFIPVLQIARTDAPFIKEVLGSDCEMIAFYCPEYSEIPFESLIIEEGKPDRWPGKLQIYTGKDHLKRLIIPSDAPQEENLFLIKWEKVIDYPDRFLRQCLFSEELICACEEILDDEYYDLFPTAEALKIGGYPTCVQDPPPVFYDSKFRPEEWEFLMQITDTDFEKFFVYDGMMTICRNKVTKELHYDVQFG